MRRTSTKCGNSELFNVNKMIINILLDIHDNKNEIIINILNYLNVILASILFLAVIGKNWEVNERILFIGEETLYDRKAG